MYSEPTITLCHTQTPSTTTEKTKAKFTGMNRIGRIEVGGGQVRISIGMERCAANFLKPASYVINREACRSAKRA